MNLNSLRVIAVGLKTWLVLWLVFMMAPVQAESPIRIALNDLPSTGMLHILVAAEHAKEQGMPVELSYLNSESMTIQAVLSGVADVGMGAPYQIVQERKLPIRMFYQLSKLAFYPVVDARYYRSWKELDGAEMYAHGPGSGTEALVNILAQRNGIRYAKMNYLPGSGTRAHAMLEGRIHATVLDAERTRMVLDADPNMRRLPVGDVNATDEALFATTDYLKSNQKQLAALIKVFVSVWRKINEDPTWLEAERQRLGLLPNMTIEDQEKVLPFIQELVSNGAYALDGGLSDAAQEDFVFYRAAGTLKGLANDLDEKDYWDFSPLRIALKGN